MAAYLTPANKFSCGVIIPDVERCASCHEKSTSKVTLLSKQGEKGVGHAAFENFYGVTLADALRNLGSYMCKQCKRALDKYCHYTHQAECLKKQLLEKCQQFQPLHAANQVPARSLATPVCEVEVSPHNITATLKSEANREGKHCFSQDISQSKPHQGGAFSLSTPTEKMYAPISKRVKCEPIDCGQVKIDDKRRQQVTWNRPTDVNIATNMSIGMRPTPANLHQFHYPHSVNVVRKTQQVTYRTSKLATQMRDIVRSLSNGSVRQSLRLLAQSYSSEFHEIVVSLIKAECKKLVKEDHSQCMRQNSPEDTGKLDVCRITQQIETFAPLTWLAICEAARGRSGFYQETKVVTAAMILLNSRSVQLNAFQYACGAALYQLHVKKEVLILLAKLGLTTSHTTLYTKLNEVPNSAENRLQVWLDQVKESEKGNTDGERYTEEQEVVSSQTHHDHAYSMESVEQMEKDGHQLNPGVGVKIDNLDYEMEFTTSPVTGSENLNSENAGPENFIK